MVGDDATTSDIPFGAIAATSIQRAELRKGLNCSCSRRIEAMRSVTTTSRFLCPRTVGFGACILPLGLRGDQNPSKSRVVVNFR